MLPCQSGCATSLLSLLFRGLPACGPSTPKVRPSSIGLRSVHHVLALALFAVVRPSLCPSRIHLPASLRSTPITALPRYYGDSDSFGTSALPEGLPDSLHPNFRPFCLQPSPDLSRRLSHVRSAPGLSCRAVSRLRPSRLGLHLFPAGSSDLQTESSSFRTDRSFASRCSPPRVTTTQLRSALVNERLTRGDFHPSVQVRSRAHEDGPPARQRRASSPAVFWPDRTRRRRAGSPPVTGRRPVLHASCLSGTSPATYLRSG